MDDVPDDCKKANVVPVFKKKDLRNNRQYSQNWVPRKMLK